MLWVVLVLVLALGALAVLVGYAVWLAHKAADLLNEVGRLADLGAQMADLLAQIQPPETVLPTVAPSERSRGPRDVR